MLKEFNGERDHVHLPVIYPPKVRLSEPVNSLKAVSSRILKVEFPAIPPFWSVRMSGGALWSPCYLVSSVDGAPIEILRQYIDNQGHPDPRRERRSPSRYPVGSICEVKGLKGACQPG
jgi:putative transposase